VWCGASSNLFLHSLPGTGKKPKVAISDLLSSLEKVETQGPDGMDDEPKDVEKDENEDDDDDKDPNADAEQDDEEDMDDYIEDYAGDDYDALGSESGGDDY
jgi:ABC-type Zn2+ transport system substrate-binding protein/surface adhesin